MVKKFILEVGRKIFSHKFFSLTMHFPAELQVFERKKPRNVSISVNELEGGFPGIAIELVNRLKNPKEEGCWNSFKRETI